MKPIPIGRTVPGGEKVHLTKQDFETHLHGVGATRTGKSKLIEWICQRLALQRQGFCLIDPHGQLYHELIRWFASVRPPIEVVPMDLSYGGRVVGFNPFHKTEGDPSARVQRIIRAVMRVWKLENTDEAPRLERRLRDIGHVLVEGGHTIDAAQYLIYPDAEYRAIRERLTASVSVRLIRKEWDRVPKREKDFDAQFESTLNKLFRLLTSQPLLRVLGLPFNNIDLEDIIENGKILLVNLQPTGDYTDEQVELIGTLLLNDIWEIGKRREGFGRRKPRPYCLIIDEFQKYLTPDVPAMLDEAAKFGLHLMLFHQRLNQLKREDEDAYSAVMTHARTKFVFGGLIREDARTMAEEIFVGQIDLKRAKVIIEQTKWWPVYGRDTVTATTASESVAVDEEGREVAMTSSSETTTDVPATRHKPFKEVTGIQTYTLDEQLWDLTDILKAQYQRHYFLCRPGHETIAVETPFVRPRYTTDEEVVAYLEERLAGYLTPAEVDRALEERHQELTGGKQIKRLYDEDHSQEDD